MGRSVWALVAALTFVARDGGAFVWPSTVDHVVKELGDENPMVRRRAARHLLELSPGVVKRVALPALTDPDAGVRVTALEALMEARTRGLGVRVIAWLGDADSRVRRAAAVALTTDPSAEAVPALGRVLSDPEGSVRIAAARALGASGVRAAVVPLLGRLDDSDPEVREAVIRSLSRLRDPASVVPLVGRIQDNRPSVRRAVATTLGLLGDARASGALLLLLRDSEESVRAAALQALGRLRSPDAVATIVSLLADERRPSVREAAFTALSEIPSDAGVDALVAALAHEDPREHSPVRVALGRAGERAVPKLVACLEGQPSPDLADGAALALGEMKATVAVAVVDAALRRGVVRPQAALRALAASGDARALVTVLEHLSSEDAWVRGAATEAASLLLDPAEPDGRAVEPVLRALDAAHGRRAERIALASLLGRTGAPAAAPVLGALALDTADAMLRLTAIQSLGLLGQGGLRGQADRDRVLLDALEDPQARIRLAAAMALRSYGSAATAGVLLDRVEHAPTGDREALLLALPGPLGVITDRTVLATAARLAREIDGPEQDLIVDALAAVPGAPGSQPLVQLAASPDVATRAKVAEALAGHPEALTTVRALARDADASVRANAAWSLGALGAAADTTLLVSMLGDRDPNVAGNAAGALGRVGSRGAAIAPSLCHAAEDERAYVRANAFSGLLIAGARCASSVERDALSRDPTEVARAAAARLVSRVPGPAPADDRDALGRCAADDPSGIVAAACATKLEPPAARETPAPHAVVSIYVVPTGSTEPTPRAPFALARPDGLLRLGVSDRRGEVSERDVPQGALHLEVPAALAE